MTITVPPVEPARLPAQSSDRAPFRLPEAALQRRLGELASRHPAVGVALAVVREGQLTSFHGLGLADIASNSPVAQDTVFRIGSVTKLFTALAVVQLWQSGLVDLDAPANDYLRAYKLVPVRSGWRPASVRHLLTHTAGIPDARGIGDLLHASFTPSGGRPPHLSVSAGEPLPSLADYYRGGLRVVAEPGTAFAYSNHGFATLGQIVEDVSAVPLRAYMREHIFEPLAMTDSDLGRSPHLAQRMATGYVLGRHGPRTVPDEDWIGAGSGGIYSTTQDMTHFIAALLNAGANEHGRVLEPASLELMFEAQFQPDPRVPGLGLGFFRGQVDGHRVVRHDGILPGFNAELMLAPDDDIGLIAMTNGSSGAFAWLQIELEGMLRELLGAPDRAPHDAPHHPEIWPDLCGRYALAAGASDLRQRLLFGGGAEVLVSAGRLTARLLTPIPALFRGVPLEPDDELDPEVFRLDTARFGMAPLRVVFSRGPDGRATAAHVDLGGQPWSFVRAALRPRKPASRP